MGPASVSALTKVDNYSRPRNFVIRTVLTLLYLVFITSGSCAVMVNKGKIGLSTGIQCKIYPGYGIHEVSWYVVSNKETNT